MKMLTVKKGIKKSEVAYELEDGRRIAVSVVRHKQTDRSLILLVTAREVDKNGKTVIVGDEPVVGAPETYTASKAGLTRDILLATIKDARIAVGEKLTGQKLAMQLWEELPEE